MKTSLFLPLLALLASPASVTKRAEEGTVQHWLANFLGGEPNREHIRFGTAFADLDHDGRTEAIVWTTAPGYCGSGGCTLFVLSYRKTGWTMISRTPITNLPIRLLPTSSHGWLDLATDVAGGGIVKSYVARLRFDGRRYAISWPKNWTGTPPPQPITGKVILENATIPLFPE